MILCKAWINIIWTGIGQWPWRLR